jgi:hypothetical protein
MKRVLTISTDFCREWDSEEFRGPWHPMIREFIQGALDAQTQDGLKPEIQYHASRGLLKISTPNIKLDPSVLLLGESTKRDDNNTIGGFGIGMKIAMLIAARNNINVTIRNGADEVWVPTLEEDKAWPGKKVLVVETRRQVRLKRSFDIEIEGVTPEVWNTVQFDHLFLQTPSNVLGKETGDLILDPSYKGRVYVKGVFVKIDDEYDFGYNLKNCKVDMSRRLTDDYDLRSNIGSIWEELAHQGINTKIFYDLLQDEKIDSDYYDYIYDSEALEHIANEFRIRHGGKTPVLSKDFEEATTFGFEPVVVSRRLYRVLTRTFKSFSDRKAMQFNKILHYVAINEAQDEIFLFCKSLLNKAGLYDEIKEFIIVEFAGKDQRRYQEDGIIYLSPKVLRSKGACLRAMIECLTQITCESYGDLMEKVWDAS